MELNDVPQTWNDQTGKVGVPDGVTGKVPLVVYLHGLVTDKIASTGGRMIADEATLKSDKWSMNTGFLVEKLIKDGKLKPLVIAAPSETLAASKSSDTLFKTLVAWGRFAELFHYENNVLSLEP